MNPFNLTGRNAFVTGASRGIGSAIAIALAEAGANVAVHHWNDGSAASEAANQISEAGRSSCVIEADLREPDSPARIAAAATEAFGAIDVLVSNVAIQHRASWSAITREQFDEQISVNWRAAFELIQQLAPAMINRRWGRILTVGSVQERKTNPQTIIYAAAKSAQAAMVRSLAREFAPHGVTVNNLAPGVILTDRNKDALADAEYCRKMLSAIPAGSFGKIEDCTGAALLLCSDAGRYITGQTVRVDGGMSL